MKKLLFLTHRFPYPANKGDKIRALNILEHLSATHEVFLGCVDGDAAGEAPVAWATGRGFHLYCGTSTRYGRLPRTAWSLLSGEPLSNGYFWHAGLGHWVEHVLKTERPEVIYVFSSAMAQYVRGRPRTSRLIMDFVDVDSVKWKQYAETRRAPVSWLYNLEAHRLLRHDRAVARVADASLFVSTAELQLFLSVAPEAASHAYAVPNGVDTIYFTATSAPPASSQIVFVGVMDYWPNVEAVQWFVNEVLPLIVKRHPAAKFKIVGSKPTAAVRELASNPAVEVTGAVDDIRPFLNAAQVVVAPLRIARGIQNKVLEGMAMGRPVVTTPQALEGIPAEDGVQALVARTPAEFCDAVVCCLEERETARIGERARDFVVSKFSWASQLKSLDVILAGLT